MTQQKIHKYTDMVSKRGGASFHVHIYAHYQNSVFDYKAKCDSCRARSLPRVAEFLASCRDVTHPNYMRWRTEFKNNEVNVRGFFFLEELQKEGHYALEFKNEAYERKVLRGLKVTTPEDQQVVDLFIDLMLNKWSAVGYGGLMAGDSDYSVVTEFWRTHSLSEDPLPGIMKTPELLKKSLD